MSVSMLDVASTLLASLVKASASRHVIATTTVALTRSIATSPTDLPEDLQGMLEDIRKELHMRTGFADAANKEFAHSYACYRWVREHLPQESAAYRKSVRRRNQAAHSCDPRWSVKHAAKENEEPPSFDTKPHEVDDEPPEVNEEPPRLAQAKAEKAAKQKAELGSHSQSRKEG